MDSQRAWLFIVICVLISLDVTKSTVIVTNPGGGNAVTIRGTLTLVCFIDSASTTLRFWYTPGHGEITACFCTSDVCNNSDVRYKCTWDISSGEFTLTLTDVNLDDDGSYRCRFVTEEDSINISVQVPINNVDVTNPSMFPVIVTENIASKFVCETSPSRPQATIQWYKKSGSDPAVRLPDGDITTPGSGASIFAKSTLQYTPVRNDHDYRVYCTAYNIDPASTFKSSKKTQLYVQYAPANPAIIGHASGATFKIIAGRSQTLTCIVQGGRPLATLSWSCLSCTEQDRSSEETVSKEVTWTAAQSQDGEICTCQASQLVWPSPRGVYVVIEVLYAPTVNSLSDDYVVENQAVAKTCSYTPGNPDTTLIEWTRSGSSTVISRDQTLTISQVNRTDAGEYTCTAKNTMNPTGESAETGEHSQTFKLIVNWTPPATPSESLPIAAIAGGAAGAVAAIVVGVVVAIAVVRRIRARPKEGGKAAPSRAEPESNLTNDHQYYNAAFHSGSSEQGGEDWVNGQPYKSPQNTGQDSELYDQIQCAQDDTTDVDNRSTYEQLDPRLRRNDGEYADINAAGAPAHEDGRDYVNLELTA